MLHGAVTQCFRDVRWNDVDYLVVDMPPGTGDVALSLSQSVPVAGAMFDVAVYPLAIGHKHHRTVAVAPSHAVGAVDSTE